MLEVLLVYFLGKKLAGQMREKGRKPAGYCWMLVGFWLLGEFAGGIAGAVIADNPGGGINGMVYLFAIIGAACGAVITFVIAGSRPSLLPDRSYTGGFPVVQRPPGE